MHLSPYTLLIVESGVIARGIQNCAIPGLEVLASGGYAWFPVSDPTTGKLKARANPEQVEFRKSLKTKGCYASRIVVATDADPSGLFIARSICRFLKDDERICFGRLTSISPSAIKEMLESALPLERNSTDKDLEQYFLARRQLSAAAKRLSNGRCTLEETFAASLLQQPYETTFFLHYETGDLFRSLNPIAVSDRSEFSASLANSSSSATEQHEWPAVSLPFSTSCLPYKVKGGFSRTQKLLNMLFSSQIPGQRQGLISYPRTACQGYYTQTWDRLGNQLIHAGDTDRLLPINLRAQIQEATVHESLHVTNTMLEPQQLRPHLNKELLGLYRLLYRHTLKSLRYPSPVPKSIIVQNTSGQKWYHAGFQAPDTDREYRFTPLRTASGFMQQLLDTGWIKASSIGQTMDACISGKIFRIESKPVDYVIPNRDHPAFVQIPADYSLPETAAKLRSYIQIDASEAKLGAAMSHTDVKPNMPNS